VEVIKKAYMRVNVVEILCTLYENGKMRHVETVPGMGGVRNKGE
jgi:hypothetical protein